MQLLTLQFFEQTEMQFPCFVRALRLKDGIFYANNLA